MIEQTTTDSRAILEFLRANRRVLYEMGVQRIGLFGSYVRGEQHPNSDIDILFEMDNMTFNLEFS
jgi:uncharacterized protein